MPDNYTSLFAKLAIGIAVWATTNIYVGAFAIALMSALTRAIFESDCGADHSRCMSKVFRYFLMSLALAMLFVHIGLWQEWNRDATIVISSIFAFMSEETMRFVIRGWNTALVKVVDKVLK